MIQGIKGIIASHLLTPNTTTLQQILIALGLIIFVKHILKLSITLADLIFKRKRDLLKHYGENSYVVITGSTGGIGNALAMEFAKLGFNIISISRNNQKLQKTEKELLKANPKIKVKSVQTDFSRASDLKIFDEIHSKIEHLDISLLVNNVGIDIPLQLHDMTPALLQRMVSINVLTTLLMTRTLLPKLRNRKKVSAVVNMSSIGGHLPMAYLAPYCASKAFVDMLTASLEKENRGLVEFVSVKPSEVSTAMTNHKETDVMTISAEQCARAILGELRKGVRQTAGHWNHKLQEALYLGLPGWLYDLVWENFVIKQFYEERGISGFKPLGR